MTSLMMHKAQCPCRASPPMGQLPSLSFLDIIFITHIYEIKVLSKDVLWHVTNVSSFVDMEDGEQVRCLWVGTPLGEVSNIKQILYTGKSGGGFLQFNSSSPQSTDSLRSPVQVVLLGSKSYRQAFGLPAMEPVFHIRVLGAMSQFCFSFKILVKTDSQKCSCWLKFVGPSIPGLV